MLRISIVAAAAAGSVYLIPVFFFSIWYSSRLDILQQLSIWADRFLASYQDMCLELW